MTMRQLRDEIKKPEWKVNGGFVYIDAEDAPPTLKVLGPRGAGCYLAGKWTFDKRQNGDLFIDHTDRTEALQLVRALNG